MTLGMLIVLGVAALAVLLFVWEPISLDTTALVVLVLLVLLGRWTQISPAEAVSGFSNPATLTVLAMLIISDGVRRTGLVQALARRASQWVGSSERRQLGATLGMAGGLSGFMNNTPVVALFLPVVSEMAHRGRVSPSKLLIPLSYASMLGGTLTLIGTSTNILAGDMSRRLLDHPIGMFEFTAVGVIVLGTGVVYLMLAAPLLLPARVKPRGSYVDSYQVGAYLRELKFWSDAPVLGQTIQQWLEESQLGVSVLALTRAECVYQNPAHDHRLQEGDVLLLHLRSDGLSRLEALPGTELLDPTELSPDKLMMSGDFDNLVEVVVQAGSAFEERRIEDVNFPRRFDAYPLAYRTRSRVMRQNFQHEVLHSGDNLLVQATRKGQERMLQSPDLVVLNAQQGPDYRPEKTAIAVIIVVLVVLVAALDILPIMITSLAGVVAMLLFGVLRPAEMYQGVDWRVIFMLAGIIPLGLALEKTGTVAYFGGILAASGRYLPAIAVLWLFYLATGLITEFISNAAAVILMLPVAVATAHQIDANPFAFVLVVMFAASTAFMGPIGYQTNLFVYGPGGYKVRDFVRIGAPLHLLLSAVTVSSIAWIWGV